MPIIKYLIIFSCSRQLGSCYPTLGLQRSTFAYNVIDLNSYLDSRTTCSSFLETFFFLQVILNFIWSVTAELVSAAPMRLRNI